MEKQRALVRKTIDKGRHAKLMRLAMKEVYLLSKKNAAVLSGVMEESIFIQAIGQLDYRHGCSAQQGVWNEFGTYFMPIGTVNNSLAVTSTSGKRAYRPFMRPALWAMMQKYPQLVKRIIFS